MARHLAVRSVAAIAVVSLFFATARPAVADTDPLAESYRLQTKNDLAGALKAMRKAVAASPGSYFVNLRLAYLSTLTGDWAGALDGYHTAADLAPAAIEPLLGEQLALVTLGRWDDAENIGKQILKADASNYLAGSRLAWTHYKKKDFQGALALYAAVLALYPGDIDMRNGLGWSLLALDRKKDAAAAFREVLVMVPGQANATAGLAAL